MYRLKLYLIYAISRINNINSLFAFITYVIWVYRGIIQAITLERNKTNKKDNIYIFTRNIIMNDEIINKLFKNISIAHDSTLSDNIIITDSYILDNNVKYNMNLSNYVNYRVNTIDILNNNPIGWKYKVNLQRNILWNSKQSNDFLSGFHHINYYPFHYNAIYNINKLLELSARGFVVYITNDSLDLKLYLGSYLYDMMRNKDIINYDLEQRELHSINVRREVLKRHSLYARLLDLSELSESNIYNLPTVSIILATKRSYYIQRIIDMINLQTYPNIELIVALHGDDFDDPYIFNTEFPTIFTTVNSNISLGGVLQKATELSHGELIAKMDDDDLYDIDHIWDLVLAYQYSYADLVSKVVKYYYFEETKNFMVGCIGMSEYDSIYALGPSLLLSKNTLYGVGGWPDLNHKEEIELSKNIRKLGGRIYRTHGYGYVYMRYQNKMHSHSSNLHDNKLIKSLKYLPITSLKEVGFSDRFINKFGNIVE